jgi:asparagine synthase (glutamine-hydrolysing)
MCGIAGILSSYILTARNICQMTNIIRHRGPDDKGFIILKHDSELISAGGKDTPKDVWETITPYRPELKIEDLSVTQCSLMFGHRRLSIFDLSPAGHQPMCYAEGRYWIIYNGEIYNHTDIRAELEKLGYKFFTPTDTEVILASYAEWGEGCINKFVGMWVFAIFDRTKNEIFLSRDRYGIKPLYYWFSPDGDFAFASEIKQFISLPGWRAILNPQRAYDHLVCSIADHTDETMFKGVYQIPGGHYFKTTLNNLKPGASGRVTSKKWYNLKRKQFNGSFDKAAIRFRQLFVQSINEHLRADVQVGSALSGGLDSSAIVCEVNRILSCNNRESLQKTFSSCSIKQEYDERKWIDIVIKHAHVDAHFIYPAVNEVFEQTSDILWHHDEPYQYQSAFLAYNVFRLTNENGVKVLLNGQGADEYLGGYGQIFIPQCADMLHHMRLISLW